MNKFNIIDNNTYQNNVKVITFALIIFQLVIIGITFLVASLNYLTILSALQFVGGLLIFRVKKYKFTAFPVIFYIICYFFHLSYYYLMQLADRYGNLFMFLGMSNSTHITTIKLCIYFFGAYIIGVSFHRRYSNSRHFRRLITLDECALIGKYITLACLFPRVYVDITYIRTNLMAGYNATFGIAINNYLMIFADLFFLGVMLAIVGNKDNQDVAFKYCILAVGFILVGMISGRRGTRIASLVGILFVYFHYVNRKNKIKRSKLITYLVLGYIFLAVIATFGDMRETGTFSLGMFFSFFGKNLTYKLILDQMGEFGYSVYTLAAAVEYFPQSGYGYGMNYIAAWVEVIPNVGGIITGLSDSLNFVMSLPTQYQSALGGSVIGEFFYNFGWFSPFAGMLLGWLQSKWYDNFDLAIENGSFSIGNVCFLLSIPPSIIWIRGVFNSFPRAILWYLIIIMFIKSILNRRNQGIFAK